MNFNTKVKQLKTLRNNVKQDKLKIDERLPKFGFDSLTALSKTDYITNRPYPHKAKKGSLDVGIKVVPVRDDYASDKHPSMIEYIILKELNDNVLFTKISPHIVGYLGVKRAKTDCKALRHLNFKTLELDHQIKSKMLLIISEFIYGDSLDVYVKNWKLTIYEWKVLIFQVIYTMHVLQKRYKFMHNDLHYGNTLISTDKYTEEFREYKTGGKTYYTKNTGIIPLLWDFEFSEIYSPPSDMPVYFRNKMLDISPFKAILSYDPYYDIHFFITSLLETNIPNEIHEWVTTVYPSEAIPEDLQKYGKSEKPRRRSDGRKTGPSKTGPPPKPEGKSDQSEDIIIPGPGTRAKNSMKAGTERKRDSYSSDYSDSSDSSTDSSRSSGTSTYSTTDSSAPTEFLLHGRLLEGAGEKLNLPTPQTLLSDNFFKELLVKPENYKNSITFEYV